MFLSGDFPFLLYFWRLGGFFSEILSESCQKLSVSYRQRNTSQGYTHDPDAVRLEERQTELFLSAFSSSTIFLAAPSLPTATLISCPAVSISFSRAGTPCLASATSCCRASSCTVAPSMVQTTVPYHIRQAFSNPPLYLHLSLLCFMAKWRSSLAGPCWLEVLLTSGHRPWEAAHGFQLLNTWVEFFRRQLGGTYPFLLLSNSCLLLTDLSSIAELLWGI